jgi:hypothetical protein
MAVLLRLRRWRTVHGAAVGVHVRALGTTANNQSQRTLTRHEELNARAAIALEAADLRDAGPSLLLPALPLSFSLSFALPLSLSLALSFALSLTFALSFSFSFPFALSLSFSFQLDQELPVSLLTKAVIALHTLS